jgi:prepilin-type N-terminal cleavage/methylation domain-containing protein
MRRFIFKNKGMTFIELIVVMGIFATISSVVLFRFTGFTTSISLQNLASDIALRLKQAQTQAISGQSALTFSGVPSYGVYFDSSLAKRQQFDFFADTNNTGLDDSVTSCLGECLDRIIINTGDYINKICFDNGTSCSTPGKVHVTFKRPFPDAVIKNDAGQSFSNAQIEVSSPQNLKKTIIVWSSGQIEIRNGSILNNFPSCSPSCL